MADRRLALLAAMCGRQQERDAAVSLVLVVLWRPKALGIGDRLKHYLTKEDLIIYLKIG